jgi:hypothetical protein
MNLMILVLAAAVVQADDAALVKAAKKVPTGTVITNDSVKKKAASNSATTGGTTSGTTSKPPAAQVTPKGPGEVQAEQRRARDAAEALLHDSDAAVAKLEKELAAVEQSYYDESNPDVRDREITKRFILTQEKLQIAKRALAAARAAVDALPPPTVTVLP